MSQFQLGDAVGLKCGGKPMVVDSIKNVVGEDQVSRPGVGCIWHDDSGKIQRANFIDEVLEKLSN